MARVKTTSLIKKPITATTTDIKKERKYRHRRGFQSLRNIRRFQKNTDIILRETPFRRLVEDILGDLEKDNDMADGSYRFSRDSLQCFRMSVEQFIVTLIDRSYKVTLHSGRKVLMSKDIEFIMKSHFEKFISTKTPVSS